MNDPTSPGLYWLTLTNGNEVLGWWEPARARGYMEVDIDSGAHDLTHEDSVIPYWCLALDLLDHDVIAWRPLVPEGKVRWYIEAQMGLGAEWQTWGPWAATPAKARRFHAEARAEDYIQAARIVRVTRVVEPEDNPAEKPEE